MATTEKVLEILTNHPEARDSDLILYSIYLEDTFNTTDLKKIAKIKKSNVLATIDRTRRRIQNQNPLLRASEDIQQYRALKEEEMREMYG